MSKTLLVPASKYTCSLPRSCCRHLSATLARLSRRSFGQPLFLAQLHELLFLEPAPRLLLLQHFLVPLFFELLGARPLVDRQRHERGRRRFAAFALELDVQAQLIGRVGIA